MPNEETRLELLLADAESRERASRRRAIWFTVIPVVVGLVFLGVTLIKVYKLNQNAADLDHKIELQNGKLELKEAETIQKNKELERKDIELGEQKNKLEQNNKALEQNNKELEHGKAELTTLTKRIEEARKKLTVTTTALNQIDKGTDDPQQTARQALRLINYEGRRELGNTQTGDGNRFRERGYLGIVGRANYQLIGHLIGVDIVADPDRVAEPEVAAKILVKWFSRKKKAYEAALHDGDYARVRRLLGGGPMQSSDQIRERTLVYQQVLEQRGSTTTPIVNVAGVTNSEWLRVHVPAILTELDAEQFSDTLLRAYVLATAEIDTKQGRIMTGPIR